MIVLSCRKVASNLVVKKIECPGKTCFGTLGKDSGGDDCITSYAQNLKTQHTIFRGDREIDCFVSDNVVPLYRMLALEETQATVH